MANAINIAAELAFIAVPGQAAPAIGFRVHSTGQIRSAISSRTRVRRPLMQDGVVDNDAKDMSG
jgi:hypothetical protein